MMYILRFRYAREIEKQLTAKALGGGMAVYLEAFTMTSLMVLIRFGMWKKILQEPIPKDCEIFAGKVAVTHYARGMAYAALGKVEAAEKEQKLFHQAMMDPLCASRILHNNVLVDPVGTVGILNVARPLLGGEIAYRKGEYKRSFELLREAVKRDDSL
eukprot:672881-Amorphochlora_amoeboformis.AAC.1